MNVLLLLLNIHNIKCVLSADQTHILSNNSLLLTGLLQLSPQILLPLWTALVVCKLQFALLHKQDYCPSVELFRETVKAVLH